MPQQAGAQAVNATTQVINQGEYLARAGDCVACHTVPNGKPFAGGRAMATPFGNLYVPNITPDDETGIGKWNADEFYRMMHTGISRDGTMLYPAMPFASVHQGHARRLRRDLRLPDVGAAGAPGRTASTSCASRSTSASS